MSSIQIKTIQGSGPYAYRVEHVEQDEQNWEYLGPAGSVDPADLTDDEIEDLREERVLSRYRDRTEADLQKLDTANDVRDRLIEEIGEDVLSYQDDRRQTVVKLSPDAPRDAEIIVENEAESMENEVRTIGQEPLTDSEKEKLDFSKKSTFWYRAAKADLTNEGINDWIKYADPDQIEDPHAQSDDLSRQDRSGGKNLDEDQRGTDTTSQREAESQQEKQALRYAQDGDEDAREYLKEQGWTDEEIEETNP